MENIKIPDEIFAALKEDKVTFKIQPCDECDSKEALEFCAKRLEEQDLQLMKILVMLKMKQEENVKIRKLYTELLQQKL